MLLPTAQFKARHMQTECPPALLTALGGGRGRRGNSTDTHRSWVKVLS